jgi:hypothetical protein
MFSDNAALSEAKRQLTKRLQTLTRAQQWWSEAIAIHRLHVETGYTDPVAVTRKRGHQVFESEQHALATIDRLTGQIEVVHARLCELLEPSEELEISR